MTVKVAWLGNSLDKTLSKPGQRRIFSTCFGAILIMPCLMVLCVCTVLSSVWQKLCEYARMMTDLQPTDLALGRMKTWLLLGYKSSRTSKPAHTTLTLTTNHWGK